MLLPAALGLGLLWVLSSAGSVAAQAVALPLGRTRTELQPPTYTVYYQRTQTVTLHSPHQSDIYAQAFTTTFQFEIADYVLGSWIVLPSDAVTRSATCRPQNPLSDTCEVLWGTGVVTFAGPPGSRGTIYLEYDTRSRASRAPGTRLVTLSYPVGPHWDEPIALTNTIRFGRELEPGYQIEAVSPDGYTIEDDSVRWVYTSTPRRTYSLTLTEPWLGADLVIRRLQMSNPHPQVGQQVHFTLTLSNEGAYGTGRAVLAELFVRPMISGTPYALTDHIGGWIQYGEAALFNWLHPATHQLFLPLVLRPGVGEGGQASLGALPWLPGPYWLAGLPVGELVTGVTSLRWPQVCAQSTCGVWTKVDPSYLDLGVVYDWYGYNPEGLVCSRDATNQPTCIEEGNNMVAYYPVVVLPLVMRGGIP